MKRFATIAVLTTSLIAGPVMAEHEDGNLLSKENVGGAIGATVGGFVGSKIGDGKGNAAATAAGAVGGFLLGRNIAHNYRGDGDDRRWHGGKHRRGHQSRGYHKPRLHPVNKTFVARTTSNVRAGPGTRFGVTGRLHDHERVHVIGKVQGRNWFMIRDNGRRGFVYAPLLRPDRHYGHRDRDGYRDHDRRYGDRDHDGYRGYRNGGKRSNW